MRVLRDWAFGNGRWGEILANLEDGTCKERNKRGVQAWGFFLFGAVSVIGKRFWS